MENEFDEIINKMIKEQNNEFTYKINKLNTILDKFLCEKKEIDEKIDIHKKINIGLDLDDTLITTDENGWQLIEDVDKYLKLLYDKYNLHIITAKNK